MTSMQLEPQWMQLKCSTLSFIVTFLYNNTEIEYETYTIQAVSYRTLFFFSLRVMAPHALQLVYYLWYRPCTQLMRGVL